MNYNNALYLSESESIITGLKTGRIDYSDTLDLLSLQNQIVTEKYDLVRFKINANNRNIYNDLNLLGFPYYLLNIGQQFKISIDPNKVYLSEPFPFEVMEVTEKHTSIVYDLVDKIITDISGSFYINPILQHLISSEKYNEALAHHLTHHNKTWLFLDGGRYVGFVSIKIAEENAEGVLFGLIPEYKNKGFSKLLFLFTLEYLKENNLKAFISNVQFHNIASIKTHLSMQAEPLYSTLNFHIIPLLSFIKKQAELIGEYSPQDAFSEMQVISNRMRQVNKYSGWMVINSWGNSPLDSSWTLIKVYALKRKKESMLFIFTYYNNNRMISNTYFNISYRENI